MTRKEMVAINNPECLNEVAWITVNGCPDDYPYLKLTEEQIMEECFKGISCKECWNKEIKGDNQ